jgi:Helix-turn-helix domain
MTLPPAPQRRRCWRNAPSIADAHFVPAAWNALLVGAAGVIDLDDVARQERCRSGLGMTLRPSSKRRVILRNGTSASAPAPSGMLSRKTSVTACVETIACVQSSISCSVADSSLSMPAEWSSWTLANAISASTSLRSDCVTATRISSRRAVVSEISWLNSAKSYAIPLSSPQSATRRGPTCMLSTGPVTSHAAAGCQAVYRDAEAGQLVQRAGEDRGMRRAIKITRLEASASALRELAARTPDGAVVRRLPGIALILGGRPREEAARLSGMDRQILCDWVHRYNAEGVAGLRSRWGAGR